MPTTTASQPTALITGANKGIGLAIARQLGERGYAVWLGCRDAERGQQAASDLHKDGIEAHALTLDVADDASVRAAAAQLGGVVDALDVLVNNAGVSLGTPGPLVAESLESMRTMFEVNTLGPLRVTQAFLPLLRQAKTARIVMMSSGLGSLAETADIAGLYWNVGHGGYCASKSALNMLTVKLAKELLTEGIKVNAADPGFTATDLNRHTGDRDVDQAATVAVHLATLGPLGLSGGFFHDGHATQARHRW